jgi:D-aminopeptidase
LKRTFGWLLAALLLPVTAMAQSTPERPRAREAGVIVGTLQPGPHNAITDVQGVRVGHTTLRVGDSINTGVTAILPPGDNWFQERVPGNVGSINPVVGETNDGGLNDIRSRPITPQDVWAALDGARNGPVEEGAVGAGTGTRALGFKGGIGTSSRVLGANQGGYTVGVLVQTNYGGSLTIAGVPVGRELARQNQAPPPDEFDGDGSIMMVVATDAPLDSRNLERLARRALVGLARTGSTMSNGSGDYVIAFSTAESVRRVGNGPFTVQDLSNNSVSSLFVAAADATEEAIYNSLFKAVTVRGRGNTSEALPIDRVLAILRSRGALAPPAL